jgi:hypothetical protein
MSDYTSDDLVLMARRRLNPRTTHTGEAIRQIVNALNKGLELPNTDVEKASKRLEMWYQTTMEFGHALTARDHLPWLQARVRDRLTPYWDRYRSYLEQDKSFPPNVVLRLNDVLDRILDLSGDPETTTLDRRGLVVGQVQSGKTANYTGLICKAVDAGYRVIFVITGIHNNLRMQTQRRVDEGFIGRDSSGRTVNPIGVGRINDNLPRPTTFTTVLSDFNGAFADQIGFNLESSKTPSVFVLKKNARVLGKLNEWLVRHSGNRDGGIALPALVIDDEADNASIDVGRDGKVSAINGHLRKLLTLFPRSSYVGYTATPFANIFIDPRTESEMYSDDLFPRSFIIALEPPSNYHGPERIFGDPGAADTHVVQASDYDGLLPLAHRRDHQLEAMPHSLEVAIDTWFVATAIRHIRHPGSFHSTMMVNVSRYVDVQGRVADLVRERVDAIVRAIRVQSRMPQGDEDPRLKGLRFAFEDQYSASGVSWHDVRLNLANSTLAVEVKVINGVSPDALDYSGSGARYIAIGGLSLSRGLTLEGLVVSYFLRSSKMYDTLMQMGRWFGYRPEYEDLVRIWLSSESKGWYEHITEVIDELRQDLIDMERTGGTPMDFGLKVRTHPDALLITARNKMGTSKTYVHSTGLSNRCVELHDVARDSTLQRRNLELGLSFLSKLRKYQSERVDRSPPGSGVLFKDVPVELLYQFLDQYRTPEPFNPSKHPSNLRRFLGGSKDQRLLLWSVFVPFGEGCEVDGSDLHPHRCLKRNTGGGSGAFLSIGDRHRVSGRGIEAAGLPRDIVNQIRSVHASKEPPDCDFRAQRAEPLFMLFFVDLTNNADATVPLVSFGLSIPPGVADGETVEYQVNQTFLDYNRELAGDQEDGSEEAE